MTTFLLVAALLMVLGARYARRLPDALYVPALWLARAVVIASCVSVFVGCTPAERCAAARGASIACSVLSRVADGACSGDVVGSGGEVLDLELSPEDRAAALQALRDATSALDGEP